MHLKVISLKNVEYEGEIASLNIQTKSGEITVLENHRPLITLLKPGKARITDLKNQLHELEVNSGFLEVGSQNRVSVLID